VERHGCAADVCIHAPGKDGDDRNHHAHILLTTRRLGPEGFGEKTRELDDQKTGPQIVTQWRERFAQLQNERLREAGHSVQVDHRSHAERGLDAEPTRHLGPAATGYERRTGEPSRKRLDFEAEIADRLTRAREAGELERQGRQIDRGILDLSGDLEAAKRERDRQLAERAAAPKTAEQSRQEAEQLARQAIGQGVRLYAVGEGATARGQIVGETAHHYVQRVSPTVAAIHEKARFGHLPPGQRPKIGQHLAIGYTDGKAKATPIQPPGRGRGLTR
jgi:hypothetical protein